MQTQIQFDDDYEDFKQYSEQCWLELSKIEDMAQHELQVGKYVDFEVQKVKAIKEFQRSKTLKELICNRANGTFKNVNELLAAFLERVKDKKNIKKLTAPELLAMLAFLISKLGYELFCGSE